MNQLVPLDVVATGPSRHEASIRDQRWSEVNVTIVTSRLRSKVALKPDAGSVASTTTFPGANWIVAAPPSTS
jgi:hypothetical protein